MTGVFEAGLLPDAEKLELCVGLLQEFGVTRWHATDKGELIHSCCLPNSSHRNGDRNPSASLNFKKLTFCCLGCGSKGGLLWFIGTCRGLDSDGARTWLEEATGTGRTVMDLSKLLGLLDNLYDGGPTSQAEIPRFDPTMIDPWTKWPNFHPYLTDGAPEIDYAGRGCHESTLKHFRVGYTDDYFMGRDQDPQERIIIPLFWKGDLIGWQARRLNPNDEPKYKNSPDFARDRVLYNYDGQQDAVVVESPLSVLRHFHHRPEMMATFGAEVTDAQTRLLHRFRKVVLWFDNDDAGWKATWNVGRELERYTPTWVVDSPYAADPGDMDDETVAHLIDAAIPYSVWAPPKQLTPWSKG